MEDGLIRSIRAPRTSLTVHYSKNDANKKCFSVAIFNQSILTTIAIVKQPVEEKEGDHRDAKKAKKKLDSPMKNLKGDPKKSFFHRLGSEVDEIKKIDSMIEYSSKEKVFDPGIMYLESFNGGFYIADVVSAFTVDRRQIVLVLQFPAWSIRFSAYHWRFPRRGSDTKVICFDSTEEGGFKPPHNRFTWRFLQSLGFFNGSFHEQKGKPSLIRMLHYFLYLESAITGSNKPEQRDTQLNGEEGTDSGKDLEKWMIAAGIEDASLVQANVSKQSTAEYGCSKEEVKDFTIKRTTNGEGSRRELYLIT